MSPRPVVFDVDRAVELYNTGQYSWREVAKLVQEKGEPPLHGPAVSKRCRQDRPNDVKRRDPVPPPPSRKKELTVLPEEAYALYRESGSICRAAEMLDVPKYRLSSALKDAGYEVSSRWTRTPPPEIPRCERCGICLREVLHDGKRCVECRLEEDQVTKAYVNAPALWGLFWSAFGRRFLELPEMTECATCGGSLVEADCHAAFWSNGVRCFDCVTERLPDNVVRRLRFHIEFCLRQHVLAKKANGCELTISDKTGQEMALERR